MAKARFPLIPLGNNNTAVGTALFRNTTGNGNIALGLKDGQNITAGDNNIHIGNKGASGDSNTIRIGAQQPKRIPSSPALEGRLSQTG